MTGVPDAYRALILSDRVSTRTRAALLERAAPDDPAYRPAALPPTAFRVLQAVLGRVLPQDVIDLAQRLDTALAGGKGDGWRYADLPGDIEAYRAGLAALDAAAAPGGFAALGAAEQDAVLSGLAAGQFPGPDPTAMQRWFEDLRGDAVKIYTAHPAILARMGYSGIGYGGDGPRKQGFQMIGPGVREPWEPLADGGA